MSLNVDDATHSLDILWDLYKVAAKEGLEKASISRAISILSAYVKDIQPPTQLSVWDHFQSGVTEGLSNLSSSNFGPLRTVELFCSPSRKLGLYLDTVSKYSTMIHCAHDHPPVVISHISSSSIADGERELQVGDQVLEINGHVLAHVSLQKARWLLESAYRSGKVTLVVVTSGLANKLKKSQLLSMTSIHGFNSKKSRSASPNPKEKQKGAPPPPKERKRQSDKHHQPVPRPAHHQPGSRPPNSSSQDVVPADGFGFAMNRRSQKRKVGKIHLMKEEGGLGVELFGGKGSASGDMGIFVQGIKEGSWVHKDGRVMVGDEVLVVNRKSLIGLSLSEAQSVISQATNPLQLVIATQKGEGDSVRSSYARSSVLSYTYFDRSRTGSQVSAARPGGLATSTEEPPRSTAASNTTASSSAVVAVNSKHFRKGVRPSVTTTSVTAATSPPPGDRPLQDHDSSWTSDSIPRVLSDSSLTQQGSDEEPTEVPTTPAKGKRTPQKKEQQPAPSSAKKSKLMGFFKREKKSSASGSPLLPAKPHSFNTLPALSSRRSAILDEISLGEELYSLDLATRPPSIAHSEENDVVGDLEVGRPSLGGGLRKKRPSTTSYSSIQSTMPEDLEIVKNWAKLTTAGSQPEGDPFNPSSMGTLKTVLLYKPPKTQPKPLGFTLHGGTSSHFGDVGIHIKSISEDSLAAADGRLREGDEILEVNSHLVDGMTHKKVAQLIKSEYSKYGMLTLKTAASRGPHEARKAVRSPSVKGTPFVAKLMKEPGAGLGIEFTGVTFDTNRFGIYIQRIVPGSPAEYIQSIQRGDQILAVNQHKLTSVKLAEVHSIFGRLPPGEVSIKLMRPTHVAAVERLLSNIASAKRKSMEGTFSVEVFGQSEGESSSPVKSPLLTPRPENAPSIDMDILDLFEKMEDGDVSDPEEMDCPRRREFSPQRQYKLDVSRHSRVDDSDSSSDEELEPVRDFPTIETVPEEPLAHSKENVSSRPAEQDNFEKKSSRNFRRPPSASFTAYDVSAQAFGGELSSMQSRFSSMEPVGMVSGGGGLARNLSLGSGSSAVSFITEMISIRKGPAGFGMTVLGGQDTPLQGALITAVDADSPAVLEGGIERGDEILEVNGQSVIGLKHSEVIGLLRQVSSTLVLKVARSPPVPTSTISLTHHSDKDSDGGDGDGGPFASKSEVFQTMPVSLADSFRDKSHAHHYHHRHRLDQSQKGNQQAQPYQPQVGSAAQLELSDEMPGDETREHPSGQSRSSAHQFEEPTRDLPSRGDVDSESPHQPTDNSPPQGWEKGEGSDVSAALRGDVGIDGEGQRPGPSRSSPAPVVRVKRGDGGGGGSPVMGSYQSLVDSTDDELEQHHHHPSIVYQLPDHRTNTLDGKVFGRGTARRFTEDPSAGAYVVSSSSDPSLSGDGDGDGSVSRQPQDLPASMRAAVSLSHSPSKEPRTSLPISKASSGVSIVVSYSVDWQEEGHQHSAPNSRGDSEEGGQGKMERVEEERAGAGTTGTSNGSKENLLKDYPLSDSRDSDLRDSPLVGSRRRAELDSVDGLDWDVPPGFNKVLISIQKKTKSGLGITVVSSSGVTAGYHQIRRILPRSLADRDGQLRPGDRLVAVNECSLRSLSHSAVLEELKQADSTCAIEVFRDPLYDFDATSLGSGSYYDSRLSIVSDEGAAETGSLRRLGGSSLGLKPSPIGTPTIAGSLRARQRQSVGAELWEQSNRTLPSSDEKRHSFPDSQRTFSFQRPPVGVSPLVAASGNPPVVLSDSPPSTPPPLSSPPRPPPATPHATPPATPPTTPPILAGGGEPAYFPLDTPPSGEPPAFPPPISPSLGDEEALLGNQSHDFLSVHQPAPLDLISDKDVFAEDQTNHDPAAAVNGADVTGTSADRLSNSADRLSKDADRLSNSADRLSKDADRLSKDADRLGNSTDRLSNSTDRLSKDADGLNKNEPTGSEPTGSEPGAEKPAVGEPLRLSKKGQGDRRSSDVPSTDGQTDGKQPRSTKDKRKSFNEVDGEEAEASKRKSTIGLPRERVFDGPFVVEVLKGFTSLGVTTEDDPMGSVAVKSIGRGPVSKSGMLKTGDWLLSVNGETVTSAQQANHIFKNLPRGQVDIVAMVSPKDMSKPEPKPQAKPKPVSPPVASPVVQEVEKPEVIKQEVPSSTQQKPEVNQPSKQEVVLPPKQEVPSKQEVAIPPKPEVPSKQEVVLPPKQEVAPKQEVTPPPTADFSAAAVQEGVIEVEITRGGQPFGVMVVGGSDMPQQYVSVHSITPGSPAHRCGSLRPGDELVMCGAECLMGLSWKEAQGIVNSVPETFTVVAQRRTKPSSPPPQQQQQQQPQLREKQRQSAKDDTNKRVSVVSDDSFISYNTVESSTNLLPLASEPAVLPEEDGEEEREEMLGSTAPHPRTPPPALDSSSLSTPVHHHRHPQGLGLENSFASFSHDEDSVFNASSPKQYHSSFESSLNDPLEEPPLADLSVEDQASGCARLDEEVHQVELQKQEGKTLGFVIAGGDMVTPDIYVKRIVANSIACTDGRLKVGDRVLFMNDTKIVGLTKPEATNLLRSAEVVNLLIARRPPVTGSALNTPLESTNTSAQGSPVATRRSSISINDPLLSSDVSGMSRQETSGTMRRRHRRSDSVASIHSVSKGKMSDSISSLHSINEDTEMDRSATLPRDVGSRKGLKMVELVKGSTGLGMKIMGGKNEPKPFIIRDVFPGGAAAKSGKIFRNDQMLELNGKSFEQLTHRDGIKYLQSVPLGKIQILLRSAEYVKVS